MEQLYKMEVISPHLKGMGKFFPDPEIARLKSLTRKNILEMGLDGIIKAADAGNLFAGQFMEALSARMGGIA